MVLTNRGRVVVATFVTVLFVAMLAIVGRVEADTQCATFQANNDYQSALDAGCSFDMLPNAEYPYTWEVAQ
jgi:hypothetical protein